MKQKVLCVLFLALFISNISAYAIQDRYLKYVTTWMNYPHTSAFDIDVEHNIIFFGVGNEVRIHDATDLKSEIPIKTITFEPNVYDLMYRDGFLYICNDDFGISVYDVTNIDHPTVAYEDKECSRALSLHANDKYIGVVTDSPDSNLSIYETEYPKVIKLIKRFQLSEVSYIKSIFIQEQIIYVVDVDEGIFMYELENILNEENEEIESTLQYDNYSDLKHLLIKDQIAYISSSVQGFSIIDVENPEQWQEYVTIDIKSPIGATIVEQYAYVASYKNQKIWVLNVENPDDISLIEIHPLDYEAYSIHAANDHLFVSSYSHMHIYQLTQGVPEPEFDADPTFGKAPLSVTFFDKSSGDVLEYKWNFGDGATSIKSDPSHTYTDAGHYTVTLAVSNGKKWYTEVKANYISVEQTLPQAYFEMKTDALLCPVIVEFIQRSSGDYTAVHWDFGDGYTSTKMDPIHEFTTTGLYHVTLTIFAMSDSFQYSRPVYVHNNFMPVTEWTSRPIYQFCTDSQKKYGFAGTSDSIDVLDISNPLTITIVQSYPLSVKPEHLFYTHNYLIAASGASGLSIFNISDPTNMKIVSQTPIDSFSRHVWVNNSYAFVSTHSGLLIYDLSAMSSPAYLTKIEKIGSAYAFKQSNSNAFIADVNGLTYYKQKNVLDFSMPTHDIMDNLVQFDIDMNYLYLARANSGMEIMQYNDQGDLLSSVGTTKENFNALDICVRNDFAYIASNQDGFYVYDVHRKDTPVLMKQYKTNDHACDVVDVSPYIFWADGKGGLRIYVQPEQNYLQMQTPRIVHPGKSYQGQVCIPYVQHDLVSIALQSNHPYITMQDESVSLTSGTLCQTFSLTVKSLPGEISSFDPQIQFIASANGFFDANSFSFMTDNEMIATYSATDLPLSIPDGQSGESIISIHETGIIQCLSTQLKIRIKKFSDLRVTLTSPQGTQIKLFEKVDPGEYLDTIEINLDDRSQINISDAKKPLSGFYQPEDNFSKVYNEDIYGEWTLLVEDTARYNPAQILAWSLYFELSSVNASPLFIQQKKARSLLSENKKSAPQRSLKILMQPEIQIINVPPIGNRIRPITGMIHNVDKFSDYLTLYILTDAWHLKPRWRNPNTLFDKDGQWQCDITTKWGDENATKIAVFLFSTEDHPSLKPDFPVLPQSLFEQSVAHKIFDRQ
jgi:PKD repeat protein/subtilisin-like proprotein convertase family protein